MRVIKIKSEFACSNDIQLQSNFTKSIMLQGEGPDFSLVVPNANSLLHPSSHHLLTAQPCLKLTTAITTIMTSDISGAILATPNSALTLHISLIQAEDC